MELSGTPPQTIVLTAAMLFGGTAAAQDHEHGPEPDPPLPEGVTLDEMLDSAEGPPPESWPAPIHDNPVLVFTIFELLEYRLSDKDRDEIGWDAQGWIGDDDHKFWWKAEGAAVFDGENEGEAEFQALYAYPISAFWFLQAGVRYDHTWLPGDSFGRFSAALGVQGLTPYKVELEPTLFLTGDGDLLLQFTASYDIYLTQRLVLQPRLELNLSANDAPKYDLAAGFNDIDLGLRLRYEIRREFAPYLGVRFTTLLGETADIAQGLGGSADDLQLVLGVRIAF